MKRVQVTAKWADGEKVDADVVCAEDGYPLFVHSMSSAAGEICTRTCSWTLYRAVMDAALRKYQYQEDMP